MEATAVRYKLKIYYNSNSHNVIRNVVVPDLLEKDEAVNRINKIMKEGYMHESKTGTLEFIPKKQIRGVTWGQC